MGERVLYGYYITTIIIGIYVTIYGYFHDSVCTARVIFSCFDIGNSPKL